MAHGKETPRQKMIGMMYLVLTALLALNVSKDILDSFVLVDSGLSQTNQNFQAKNDFIYSEFGKAMATSSESKVRPWRDSALVVKKFADNIYNHIEKLKKEIILEAEGDSIAFQGGKINGTLINAKDNMDIPAQIMVGDNNDKAGKQLKLMIENFRDRLIKMAGGQTGLIESLNKTLITADPPTKEGENPSTWEREHFEYKPLIAVTTLMSKLQGDIRNAESEMIRYLFSMIEAGSFKFNKLEATVIPNSSYIIKGNEYKADVFIAAFDTSQIPQIYIGQTQEVKNADGSTELQMVGKYETLPINPDTRKGEYKRIGSTTGTNRWSGLISLQSSDGTWIKRKFSAEYIVAEPNVVISPTKMNVFYIGVDNPVAISIPGVPHNKIEAKTYNGLLKKEGTGWIAKPESPGNALIEVIAEIDGKKKKMGSMEFRVKNLPDPIPKVGGYKTGKIDKKVLMEQSMVIADLEAFDFNAKYTVTEFNVSAKGRGGFEVSEPSRSYKITDGQKAIFANANKGDRIVFSEIKAIGPDGKPRELNAIVLTIK